MEYERGRPVGVRRCEEEGQRCAVRRAMERRPLRAGRVHDGSDVVHPLLEWGRAGDGIRDSAAALVEEDHPGEGREAAVESSPAFLLPAVLDVGE
jgi:hypothetical protein